MAGLFGLGGFGGIGGAQPPAGLLGPYFNPADMRKQQLKQGLLAAGIGLLTGGKGSTGEVLGQGLAAGLQGANNAGINYKQDAMGYNKLAMDMQEQERKRKQEAAVAKMVESAPPHLKALWEAYPELGAKAYLEMESGGKGDEYGLNPVWTQDAEGKWHLYQPNKGGGDPRLMDFGGNTPQPTQTYLNQGTQFMQAPSRGALPQNPAVIPIDNAGKQQAEEIGTAAGKQIAAAPADIAAADEALNLIDQIAVDPNLDWGVGMTSLGNMIPGSPGRDFQSRVDQAKSGAFLSAIQQLRGMGSLSNAEGDTATKAVTRLNTATSKEEFLSALGDYRKIVQMGRQRAAARIPGGAQAPAVNPAPRLRFNPQTGELE